MLARVEKILSAVVMFLAHCLPVLVVTSRHLA